ncbi:probable pectin methylesterase CGR2 [Actinidia eriantha]|uniref:probable pectin methylesterase CGR2 n=1 Tax=Actinidia eriantha TaxID=165200 RepID=UPI00258D500D|nr:probable pectin methylesterase CGR2 [Actinidia eriantha]
MFCSTFCFLLSEKRFGRHPLVFCHQSACLTMFFLVDTLFLGRIVMSRKQPNPAQRLEGNGPFGGLFHPKSRIPPMLSVVLIIVGLVLPIGHFRSGSGIFGGQKEATNKVVFSQ